MESTLEPIEPHEALQMYLRDRSSDLASSSLKAHEYRLNHLVRWCDEVGVTNLNTLSGRDLHEYKTWRREDGGLNIEETIRQICANEPFATVDDIDEWLPITRETVLNNVGTVVEKRIDIGSRKVGQANVYFVKKNIVEVILHDGARSAVHLENESEAEYSALWEPSDDTSFELEVPWYDDRAVELEEYVPTVCDVGESLCVFELLPEDVRLFDGYDRDEVPEIILHG